MEILERPRVLRKIKKKALFLLVRPQKKLTSKSTGIIHIAVLNNE